MALFIPHRCPKCFESVTLIQPPVIGPHPPAGSKPLTEGWGQENRMDHLHFHCDTK